MITPDPYSLNLLHDTGPAPLGLDDRETPRAAQLDGLARDPPFAWGPWEEPARYADWEAGDLPLAQHVDRPSEGQEWGATAAMWGLGLCAGLMVLGVVVQMVTGGR